MTGLGVCCGTETHNTLGKISDVPQLLNHIFIPSQWLSQVSCLVLQHGGVWSPLYQAGHHGEWKFPVYWLFAAHQEQVSKMNLFHFYCTASRVTDLQLWVLRTWDLSYQNNDFSWFISLIHHWNSLLTNALSTPSQPLFPKCVPQSNLFTATNGKCILRLSFGFISDNNSSASY